MFGPSCHVSPGKRHRGAEQDTEQQQREMGEARLHLWAECTASQAEADRL